MSNLTLSISYNLSLSAQELPSLDQLLYALGYTDWQIIITTFVLPSVNFVGLLLSALSAWIFFQRYFRDPVFFYYRLLCLVYIIHLAHNIPSALFFVPRYFPKINMYSNSLFQIYYGFTGIFLFHFEETLQISILLMRIKIFIPVVRRNFTAKPPIVSLIFFFVCLCIDLPIIFSQQVIVWGSYQVLDETNGSTQRLTYYSGGASDFNETFWGKFLALFTGFANLFLSIVFGFILNIVSFLKFKLYLKEKREKFAQNYDLATINNNTKNSLQIQQVARPVLTQKEINENKAEKSMFFMALTLCTISLVSRVLIICCIALFLFFNSFTVNVLIGIVSFSVQTFVPASSIFVFYFFNKTFREEFKRISFRRFNSTSE
jgi:hypothetical protein